MPSNWPEREMSGVDCTARMPDRREASRSAVSAIASQASTSGTMVRAPEDIARPQLQAELTLTISQNAADSGWKPRCASKRSSAPIGRESLQARHVCGRQLSSCLEDARIESVNVAFLNK